MTADVRLLLLSDIHAYAEALRRVLAHAAGSWDEVLLLGDVVGYGPEPVQVVDILRALPLRAAVSGNHEAMLWRVLGGEPVHAARPVVTALRSHALQLEEEHLAFLRGMREDVVAEGWAAVHGSPRQRFAYLMSVPDARANEPHMPRDVVFIGHTHIPGAYVSGGRKMEEGRTVDGGRAASGRRAWRVVPVKQGSQRLTLEPGVKAFVNPGAVGPARDGGSGASYAIFDERARTVVWHRGV